jgi:hypothetical protein
MRHTCEELLLDLNSISNNMLDGVRVGAMLEVTEEQTREVGVHALVTADELVREGETRHQALLLQPEDGCERAREKDTLNSGESD